MTNCNHGHISVMHEDIYLKLEICSLLKEQSFCHEGRQLGELLKELCPFLDLDIFHYPAPAA